MAITHRENAREVFAGGKAARPLVDLGGRVASLNISSYQALKAYLGFGGQMTFETTTLVNTIAHFDERILTRLGVPFRRVFLRPPSTFSLIVASDGSFQDEWGASYQSIGPYNERVGYPLAKAGLDDIDKYAWPNPNDPARVQGLAEEAQNLFENSEYCLVAGHISAGIFQDCWNLRGMAQFMVDLASDRLFAEALLERVTAFHISMWNQFLDAVGPYVDVVETADDLGGQNGLLISPKMYRQLIKPYHAALNLAIRARTEAPILYHSCGAILPLIDDLIEIGVDILNPIQPLPGLMEPEVLNERYGDRLIFHGGLDVQNLLINGTPREVRDHIRHYLDVLGPERYIPAPANTVLPGTPPENLVAAFDAANSF